VFYQNSGRSLLKNFLFNHGSQLTIPSDLRRVLCHPACYAMPTSTGPKHSKYPTLELLEAVIPRTSCPYLLEFPFLSHVTLCVGQRTSTMVSLDYAYSINDQGGLIRVMFGDPIHQVTEGAMPTTKGCKRGHRSGLSAEARQGLSSRLRLPRDLESVIMHTRTHLLN